MQNFPNLSPSELIALISSSFDFELVDPPLPHFVAMGRLRIVGVVINEGAEPEICLRKESDPEDHVEILPISHLKVDFSLSVAA